MKTKDATPESVIIRLTGECIFTGKDGKGTVTTVKDQGLEALDSFLQTINIALADDSLNAAAKPFDEMVKKVLKQLKATKSDGDVSLVISIKSILEPGAGVLHHNFVFGLRDSNGNPITSKSKRRKVETRSPTSIKTKRQPIKRGNHYKMII
jgi:hypothetical protein